jgi:biopolymer transport protein ExbB/TolQ
MHDNPNEDNHEPKDNKVAITYQVAFGILITIILIIAGSSLNETRGDINEVKKANAAACDRITILETASKMQFEAIRQWKDEVKAGMIKIENKIDAHEQKAQVSRAKRSASNAENN